MATMQCGFVRMKFSLLFYSPEVFTSIPRVIPCNTQKFTVYFV